jgi:hypothetical protein
MKYKNINSNKSIPYSPCLHLNLSVYIQLMDYRIFEKHHRQLRINRILWSLDLCEKKNIILILSNVTYAGFQVDNFNPIACCSVGFNDKPQDNS